MLKVYVIIIKHAKFSYSSIESQLLPCAPAYGYKFHALAVYLNPTFKAPFHSEAHLESSRISAVRLFLRELSTSLGCWLFSQTSSIMHV